MNAEAAQRFAAAEQSVAEASADAPQQLTVVAFFKDMPSLSGVHLVGSRAERKAASECAGC